MEMTTAKDINPLLQYLFGLERKGIKVGLTHTAELVKRCGNPETSFRSIHVAGTNGKGSTCTMMASIFREYGLKVGLYTSPHLIRFNERIRVNGSPINDEEIIDFVQKHQADIEDIQSTFFETTTAMAFTHFQQHNVDVAVIETGLGGRLDSTNVIHPDMTVITPIGMDHTEFLGDTLTSIAKEKAGIIKEKTPLILAEQSVDAERVVLKKSEEKSVSVQKIKHDDIRVIQSDTAGTKFSYQGSVFNTPLLGEYQALNTAMAIKTVTEFVPEITDDIVNAGLQKTQWPGRIQLLDSSFPIYYDVAHNGHGILAVLEWLNRQYSEKPAGIFVLKADKELEKMKSILSGAFSPLIITSIPEAGLMNTEALGKSMKEINVDHMQVDDFSEAVQHLKEMVADQKPGLIFGSHYIASAVFDHFDFFFDKGVI